MSTIDISQVTSIVARDGYAAGFQAYGTEPKVYPLITEVVDLPPGLLGDKGSVISGLGDLKEVLDGEEIPGDTIKGARTWYAKMRRFGGRLDLPNRLLEAADASGKVPALITKFTEMWGKRAVSQKEQIVANVFQRGTIAAGDTAVFDGSFPDNADANIGFIFDGKPFFAATGNGHPLLAASDTPFNLIAANPLSSTALQTVMTAMRTTNAIDDRALKISIRPTHLLVPPDLEYTARTILNSALLPGSANNDANVVAGALIPVVWRFLTDDTTQWYVGAIGQGGGVRVYDSGMPVFETFYDAVHKQVVVTAEFQFGTTVTDWRQWFANDKATS